MRPIALVFAVMLLLAPAALAQNNTTTEDNTTSANETASNQTMEADPSDEDPGNVTLPEREGVPWGGLALGAVIFVGSIALSRAADSGDEP